MVVFDVSAESSAATREAAQRLLHDADSVAARLLAAEGSTGIGGVSVRAGVVAVADYPNPIRVYANLTADPKSFAASLKTALGNAKPNPTAADTQTTPPPQQQPSEARAYEAALRTLHTRVSWAAAGARCVVLFVGDGRPHEAGFVPGAPFWKDEAD
jgi:hypothetical protein